jgi:hypothetical protein
MQTALQPNDGRPLVWRKRPFEGEKQLVFEYLAGQDYGWTQGCSSRCPGGCFACTIPDGETRDRPQREGWELTLATRKERLSPRTELSAALVGRRRQEVLQTPRSPSRFRSTPTSSPGPTRWRPVRWMRRSGVTRRLFLAAALGRRAGDESTRAECGARGRSA